MHENMFLKKLSGKDEFRGKKGGGDVVICTLLIGLT